MPEYTGTPMAPDHKLGGIYAIMDRHGMLPDDWFCGRCAKPLNADGGHPAELYAGTFTGLCYGCTSAGPYVAAVAVLDGARRVSWPPHCPSWRRDRETHIGYEGCGNCDGLGITKGTRGNGSGGHYCEPCTARFYRHPVRAAAGRWTEQAMRSCQAEFERAWDQAAGVPKRCPNKRRLELRALYAGPDREHQAPEFAALKATYKAGHDRIRALIRSHFEARGWNVWTEPDRGEEFWLSYCRWRKMDPGTGLTYGYPKGFRYAHQPAPMCHEHRHTDGCDECTARILGAQSFGTIDDWYRLGHIGQRWFEAYMHLWATGAHRYSGIGAGFERPPEDPKVIEMVALMRRAAAERKNND